MKESGHYERSSLIKQCFLFSGVFPEVGEKIMEIKVAEINAPLN